MQSLQNLRLATHDYVMSSCKGWLAGYLTGTAILAGGKAWTVLVSSNQSVHHLLGHYGTPSFRRQLAITGVAYMLAKCVVYKIGHALKKPQKQKVIFSLLIGGSLGFAIGGTATHQMYRGISYGLGALVAADFAIGLFARTKPANKTT